MPGASGCVLSLSASAGNCINARPSTRSTFSRGSPPGRSSIGVSKQPMMVDSTPTATGPPLPATPLYKRLEAAGRLTRPRHWNEFMPFAMAHKPLKITIEEAHAEVKYGWTHAYSPEALAQAVESLDHERLGYRINIFLARLFFRGIYFPMLSKWSWLKVIAQNHRTILKLTMEAIFGRKTRPRNPAAQDSFEAVATHDVSGESPA